MGYKTENHGDLPYSQTLSRRCPFKMGFAFEKQPKPENYLTTINRFKPVSIYKPQF
jgi:hypothetical protein